LESLYEDEQFADLFGVRGNPAEAPWRLALLTAIQFVEDLTDVQAAGMRSGGWKKAVLMV
jgi:transposase